MNEHIDEAQKNILDEANLNRVSEFFRLMGDNTRLNILIALNHQEFCVSDLVKILNMSQSTKLRQHSTWHHCLMSMPHA